ncbi:MAG: hypothetical protein AB8B59_07880 [Maribacter sp.]
MNKIKKSLLGILLFSLFLLSCNYAPPTKSDSVEKNDSFKKELIETRLGKSNLYVSLPKNYKIEENIGSDFEVYYFTPIDTNKVQSLSGGLYLGNHPSEFEPSNDSCKTDFMTNQVFSKQRKWKIYDCKGEFLLQTIINNKRGEDWNQKIHIFGNTKSKEDLNNLVDIYSSLNHK